MICYVKYETGEVPGWQPVRLWWKMADIRDFLPEAGPPAAGKSQMKPAPSMNVNDLNPNTGVYVLFGSNGAYMYKGSARNLRKRVTDHLEGRVARTRNRRPLKLVHIEYTSDYREAKQRENWLKSGQGRKWLKKKVCLGGEMADTRDLKSLGT